MKKLFDDAISGLEALSADLETDDATRREANAKIKVLRTKSQEASFAALTSRTVNLQALMANLEPVINKAEEGGLGEKVAGLKNIVCQARTTLETYKSQAEGLISDLS